MHRRRRWWWPAPAHHSCTADARLLFFHDDRINALKSSLKQLQVQFDNQRILLQQKDEELRKDKAEYRRLQAEGGGALSPGSPQHGRLGHSPPGSPRELDAMGRKELLHMQQARRP